MLTNKWIIVALGALVTLTGYFSTVDWNTLLPSQAGAIMPPPGQNVIKSTGGSILTHT